MKYRTKLYFALAGTAIVSSLSGFGVLLFEFKAHAIIDERVKVITAAATTAALVDPELFKNINTKADVDTEQYQAAKRLLIKARDANRRENIYIKFLYTLKPNPDNPQEMVYVVDADESHPVLPGGVDRKHDVIGILNHLGDYYSADKFIADKWGKWLSGYTPMFDGEGNYVATVGADMSEARYLLDIRHMMETICFGFVLGLVFALVGGYFLSRRVTISLNRLLLCVQDIGKGNLQAKAALDTHDEFSVLAKEINNMTLGLQERERMKSNFARYVSGFVMEKILKSENVAKLEGERRKITVLFSDIRQFTLLSENMPPEKVVSLLNEYFEIMLDVIFRHQGTLDKFLGDGIMVEFGAPLDDPQQEKHAVITAIEMQRELKQLLVKWQKEGKPQIEIGIGVHTGLAVVGNIGSERRLEYTAIGDTVNVASRLEHATKVIKKSILISETTYNGIKDEFKATSLGPMVLPGRKEPVNIYSIDPFE